MILHSNDTQEQEVVLHHSGVVIKRATSSDSISRLQIEKSIYEHLGSHPYIAKFLAYKEGELTLAFCAHKDLLEYAGTFPDQLIPENELSGICQQIASAMAYCHYRKVTHRDLKLENVFLDSEKQVRVGDFGFARRFTRMGQKFEPAGTLELYSPEHFLGYMTPRTDLWSFGVLMFELYAGYLPFETNDIVRNKPHTWPEGVGTPHIQALVESLLSYNPKHRPLFKYILLNLN
jgi:serine/threonine protein kinase